MSNFPIHVQQLGLCNYLSTWQAMQSFTNQRTEHTPDEIWVLEHLPVFTQGQAGKAEHILMPGNIPVVQTDRGGQVTYHGPGQLVVYLLIDLKRRNLGLRQMIDAIEQSVIHLLAGYGIIAHSKAKAPGVYVTDAKICSLGLRIRRGCSYHGLSLNVAMDLAPFSQINPCGFPGLAITQLQDLGVNDNLQLVARKLVEILLNFLMEKGKGIIKAEV